jgi:hypothetical protein
MLPIGHTMGAQVLIAVYRWDETLSRNSEQSIGCGGIVAIVEADAERRCGLGYPF